MKAKIKVDQPSVGLNGLPIDFTPVYQIDASTSCDLTANCPPDGNQQKMAVIPPRGNIVIDCGFTITVPDGYKAVVKLKDYARDKGLTETSNVFIGERRANVRVRNVGRDIFMIHHGDKFAEMCIEPIYRIDFEKE